MGPKRSPYLKLVLFGVVFVISLMLFSSAYAGIQAIGPSQSGSGATAGPQVNTAQLSSSGAKTASSFTPWVFPDLVSQEPGYTGGDFKIGQDGATSEAGNPITTAPNFPLCVKWDVYQGGTWSDPSTGAPIPWLFSSWNSSVLPAGTTCFDGLNGSTVPVSCVYTVHLRNDVRWQDWTPANNNDTYVYSNYDFFYNAAGNKITHTYSFSPITMRTYYLQSADVILSYEMEGLYPCYASYFGDVVNVIPVNNMTVQFYLIHSDPTITSTAFYNYILPYHIWKSHDYADLPGDWNYTGAPNGYDKWQLGLNPTTGQIPDAIGTGPFMIAGNSALGVPAGDLLSNFNITLYTNPTYWTQYNATYRSWTPKISELQYIVYLSSTAELTALSEHQIDFLGTIAPTDVPTVLGSPEGKVLIQPGVDFGLMFMNTTSTDPPYNVTAFRQALNYATPKTYFMDTFGEGYGTVGQSLTVPANAPWYDANIPQYRFNLTKAKALIASIPGMTLVKGDWYYLGKPVTADIKTTTVAVTPTAIEEDLVLAQDWGSIGVPTTITQEPTITLFAQVGERSGFQIASLACTVGLGNPASQGFNCYYNPAYKYFFYMGPFSNITYNGVAYTGAQITSLLVNLTDVLSSTTNLSLAVSVSHEIQYIGALEANPINFGYGDNLWAYQNSTFTGIQNNLLSAYQFVDFESMLVHLKTKVTVTNVSQQKIYLSVGLTLDRTLYYNGQYGNLTIQVRNQYGSAMPGMNVTVGISPAFGLINISANKGVTNAAGQYVWEFQAFSGVPYQLTSGYYSEISIDVAAFSSLTNIVSGIANTSVSISPLPAYIVPTGVQNLYNGSGYHYINFTVMSSSGVPISGYDYEIQGLSSYLNITNITGTLSHTAGTSSVMAVYSKTLGAGGSLVDSYNLTSVIGTTSSNGKISIMAELNSSSHLNLSSNSILSYIFFGNYALGVPVQGEEPYQVIGEMTSAQNSLGVGTQQPVELPVSLSEASPLYKVSITSNSTSISPSATATINITVVYSSNNTPAANVQVNLMSQNIIGPNRGFFYAQNGQEFRVANPNELFGSTYLPGIELVTNSKGVASATFTPEFYQANYVSGVFIGFSAMSYPVSSYIPFDAFELTAYTSTNLSVASTTITSSPVYVPSVNEPVTTAYLQGATYSSGDLFIVGGNHTIYFNSTLVDPAGEYAPGVSFTVSISLGSVSVSSGVTNSSGVYMANVDLPSVSVVTPVVITVSTLSSSGATVNVAKETIYLTPSTSVVSPKVKTVIPDLYYALLGVFIVLTVIFAALYVMVIRKTPKGKDEPETPVKNN